MFLKKYTRDTPRDEPNVQTPFELIQERLVAVCAAIDAKDIEAIEKEYDSDVIVFPGPPASGAALHGLAEFRPLIDATFKNGVSLAHDLIAVTVLNERAVHADMFYWNKNDPELKKGACTSVYIKNDAGKWVIWRDIWN